MKTKDIVKYVRCRDEHGRRTFEHILIAEKASGVRLGGKHPVHHVNGVRHDNRNSNLVICEDASYHNLLHYRSRILAAGGRPGIHKICSTCEQLLSVSEFGKRNGGDGFKGECRKCECASKRRRMEAMSPEERKTVRRRRFVTWYSGLSPDRKRELFRKQYGYRTKKHKEKYGTS